jgi:hypothetical protein
MFIYKGKNPQLDSNIKLQKEGKKKWNGLNCSSFSNPHTYTVE